MAFVNNNTATFTANDIAAKAGLRKITTPVVSQDRKPSTDWLNIGIVIEDIKDEQGNPVVVTLPLGVAIDNMKITGSTNSPIYACRKALLEKLQAMFAEMPEGTRVNLPMLVVQAYKAPTEKPESKSEADAKAAVDNLFKDFSMPSKAEIDATLAASAKPEEAKGDKDSKESIPF